MVSVCASQLRGDLLNRFWCPSHRGSIDSESEGAYMSNTSPDGKTGKSGSRASMSRAIVDLWRQIQYLQNFCILNCEPLFLLLHLACFSIICPAFACPPLPGIFTDTGFVKITKKFNKLVESGSHITKSIMAHVNTTSLQKVRAAILIVCLCRRHRRWNYLLMTVLMCSKQK